MLGLRRFLSKSPLYQYGKALSFSYSCPPFSPDVQQLKPTPSESSIHFSVDDTVMLLCDLEDRRYTSIFSHPSFAFFRFLHKKFGAVFSFYCFYSWGNRNLSQVSNRFANEFKQNSDWLKFGYHAYDCDSYKVPNVDIEAEGYKLVVSHLLRITGSFNSVTRVIRGDRYFFSANILFALKNLPEGICGLLCPTSPSSTCYDLSAKDRNLLYRQQKLVKPNSISYYPSHLCLDKITDDFSFYESLYEHCDAPILVCFTHNWALNDPNVQRYILWLCQYAVYSHRRFLYPIGKDGHA